MQVLWPSVKYQETQTFKNIKPLFLGVQQKSLVVTSNYEARKLGVKKLMSVKDAKEKCPQLVLVNGEDLTPYREMSYKVTGTKLTFFWYRTKKIQLNSVCTCTRMQYYYYVLL